MPRYNKIDRDLFEDTSALIERRSVGPKNARITTLGNAGYATRPELATYLQFGVRRIDDAVAAHGLTPNRAGRFEWTKIWAQLWLIHNVPADAFERMKQPVLTDNDVAEMLGVSAKSVRRDGNRANPRYQLPKFLDLTPHTRRHHPERIHARLKGLEDAQWLRPQPLRKTLDVGLKPRSKPPGGSARA